MKLTITTKYQGPTDTKGSRLIASGFGKRATVSYDYSLGSFENHKKAAQALVDREGLKVQVKETNDNLKTGHRFIVEVDQSEIDNLAK